MSTIYRTMDDEHMPRIVRGDGSWLQTEDGRELLDMSSGPISFNFGHSNEFITGAVIDQIEKFPSAFSGFFRSEPADEAGDRLKYFFEEDNPGWFGGVLFLQGGGEAVDLACKLAAQYHIEGYKDRLIYPAPRSTIVCREHAFHGVGLLPWSLTGEYPRYYPIDEYHINTRIRYTYRAPHTFTTHPAVAVEATRKIIYRERPAAMILEPVNGPPTGCHVEQPEYLRAIRDTCYENDTLLIYDEILCGMGRCGYISTAAYYKVWPDIVLLGKGLAAGYQPVTAIVMSKKVTDRIKQGSGKIMFGTTHSAHTTGCAAAAAVLQLIEEQKILERIQLGYSNMKSDVAEALAPVKRCIHAIRGLGYLIGVQFIDPRTGISFDPKYEFHAKVRQAVLEEGAIVYTKGGTVNGREDFMVIAPPLNVRYTEWHQGLQMIQRGIEKCLKQLAT